jgi:hypothetical protein
MPSTYYLGTSPTEALGDSPQFFYGMRRNDDGELFLIRSDQLRDFDAVEINNPESVGETFDDFEAGVDYFDGVDADHDIVYSGLKYTQYKWDDRSIFYYVDSNGNLVMRINKGYNYPDGTSSNS